MNGQTTTYTLDLHSGLTQVLNDGAYTYTYGIGRISQHNGSTTEYFLGDALGSVRQMTDAAGAVTLTKSYAPYGEALSSAGDGASAYGFTGEWTDVSGLVYLRARYYAPWDGRFVSRDRWEGNIQRSLSFNPWLYVLANPVNLTDPSGRQPFPLPPQPDARDLTDWLVREMDANADSDDVRTIRALNRAWLWVTPIFPPVGALLQGFAYAWWKDLVEDGARWDFKDKINANLGKTIMLCHRGGCEWFEYSVPGNIHYGYVGRAAAFAEGTLHAGASVAEITDPAHWEELKAYGRTLLVTPEYINLHLLCRLNVYVRYRWWRVGFDDPTDYAAVAFGFALYERAKNNVSLADFQALLPRYSSQLMHMPEPVEPYVEPEVWPYPLGYFDGGKQ